MELPVIRLTATPEVLNEAEGTILTYNFSVEGEIPEGGITFRSDDIFDAETDWPTFNFEEADPAQIGGLEIVDFERVVADNGNATFLVTWNITEAEGFVKLPVLDDTVADIDSSFTVGLLPGDGYTLDPAATSVTVEIVDGVDTTGGPVIAMAISDTEVNEGDPVTLTFTTEGELPEGGQEIFINSDVQNALGEFVTVDESGNPNIITEGIANIEPTFSGFIATVEDSTATISFDIFDDGPGEGAETFTYSLSDGENYDIDPNNNSFAITLDDSDTPPVAAPAPDLPVVSLIIEPEAVSEEDAPLTTNFRFIVDGEIPEGGLPILFGGEGNDLIEILDQLDGNFTQELIGMESLGFFPAQGVVGLNLLENEAVLTRTIGNDIIQEEDRTFVFNVVPNDENLVESEYIVSSETGSDSLTLTDDNGGPGVGPTVGLSFTNTELTEGDEFTVNFDVDGDIPESGLQVLVSGSERGILGEFEIFNAGGSPAFSTTGIEGLPQVGDSRASSFLVTLTEPNASITLSAFRDNIAEDTEELSFSIVDGEEYEVAADTGGVTFNISDVILDGSEPLNEAVFDFDWTGQIADFGVEGQFSYDANQSFIDGIVREEDLLSFDVSFFDPDGNLLRTYEDNHLTFPEFNFAYDTTTGEILTDGIYTEPDGFSVGEKTAVGEDSFTGLHFWSKSKETSPSLLHIDDWSDEFGFPLGYSTHEDIAFLTRTNTESIETGKVGDFYLEATQATPDEVGQAIVVTPALDIPPGTGNIVSVDFSTTTFVEELGNTEPGALESPQSLTVTFTVEGEIDEAAPPIINFASSEPDGLTRFSLTELDANNLIPMADTANFEFTDADITLLAQTSSFTVPVFNLPDDRDLDGDGIIEDFAGETETVQFTIGPVTDGVSIDPETAEFTGTFFETIADAEDSNGEEENLQFNPIFGTTNSDVIELTDSNQIIFAGDLNDLVDASTGDGDNRIYAGSGDDTLVLGESDRVFLGEGDDRFFAISGGDNIITGGAGADQFWIASAEIPDVANIITDFTSGEDVIGIAGLGIGFEGLSITDLEGDALIAANGSDLAILSGVDATSLNDSDFAFV